MSPQSCRRPQVELFAAAELPQIVEEACSLLATCGVIVENQAGQQLLCDAGGQYREGRCRIPETLVRQALATAPRQFLVYDARGEVAMDLGGDRVHFDPGSAAVHLYDAGQGQRRAPQTKDIIEMIRLVDGLPGFAAQSTAITPNDVPETAADWFRLYLALRFGNKPVVTGTFCIDGFEPMRRLLVAVRGSDGALAEKPLAIFDCCPSPPLKWSDLTCQSLMDCARAGIPAELVAMPMAGATAPVTLREAVIQHCAENLSGLVIHQLAHAGAPIIYGGAPAAFDMRQGSTPMGAMETMMLHVAYAQVGKHLGLPTHGYLAVSDAKTPDYQAGLETGIGAVLAALAGINVVSGPGMLDYLLTQSLEKILLDHEACTMALRLVRGIEQQPANIPALFQDLIQGGELLSHQHTRAHWRQELGIASPLIDRLTYSDWEQRGRLTAQQRAQHEVQRRLAAAANSSELVDAELAGTLDEIMIAEAARRGIQAELASLIQQETKRPDRVG